MKISQHLDLSELTRSESAKRNGISNMPTPEHIENLKLLAETIFEPIRDYFKIPIRVSSGYRSKDLNAFIKGSSKTSDHCFGRAIDIDMDGTLTTNNEIFNFIKDNLKFKQLIFEFPVNGQASWIHVSYDSNNLKNEILVAKKLYGKTVYVNYKTDSDLI
jgi:zinc D-Ala-D-Ala carboxypeptidase